MRPNPPHPASGHPAPDRPQPDHPQPGGPPPGHPRPGGPPVAGGRVPGVPARPRVGVGFAVPAGILALLTAALLGSFALWSLVYAVGPGGRWSVIAVEDVFGGVVSAAILVALGGFMFARRIWAAWTACGLCLLYTLATLASPLLQGTSMSYQLTWLFGFQKPNGILMGLAIIFSVLTAVTSAAAAVMRPRRPATSPGR